jgi:ABC-type glutathione transport system ATPase component
MQFDDNAPVLEIKDLNLSYFTRAGEIPAVIDFSLTVNKGESIGLVGESGCGKSTVAMAIMQYMGGNGAIRSGSIKFKGVEMNELTPEQLRNLRGSEISMIYQEPFASLNPSLLLGSQLIARGRKAARSGAGDGRVSAPDLRRPAAACGHRHGAVVPTVVAAARRTDYRARCDRRGRYH